MQKTAHVLLLFFVVLALALPAVAQQSAKSKSRDNFRQKDNSDNKITIRNAKELNTEAKDFSPAFFQNGIVFVSGRAKHGAKDKRKESFFELYFAPFDPVGDPASPQKFSISINSALHEGPVAFSRDYKTIFFTRNNMRKGVQKADKSGLVRLKIYEAQDGYPDWANERELPFNSDAYSCIHPSLSADGKHLFFASDMPGGEGGFDIWVSERSPSGWGAPRNLGPHVNSEKNEIFPHVTLSGALYFASDGHNTMGGLDIFVSDNAISAPTEWINLGSPFNTEADDFAIIWDDDGKNGYFTSNRKGGFGKDDIYRFTIEKGIEGLAKPKSLRSEISVVDAKTGQPIQGASIRILQLSKDGFVSGKNDFYTIDLAPVQDRPNALSMRLVRKDAKDLGTPDLYSNTLGKAESDFTIYRSYMVLVSMDGYKTSEKLFYLEKDDEAPSLTFSLQEAPFCHRSGGIVSTTELGTRIANATLTFIHKRTGHREFVRTNLNGEYDICLPLEGDYLVQVERDDFKPESLTVTAKRSAAAFSEVRLRPTIEGVTAEAAMPLASGLRTGSVLILDKVFYRFDKATLNQNAVRHIDALHDLLTRFPTMQIEIAVHTETRGDSGMNMTLTEERATNIKKYLVYRGIAPERISTIAKGDTEPRNRCKKTVDCSDDEHQENNRLEVRILNL